MAFKPPVAVFDACVLYPFHTRNVIVQAAVDRLVDARWTDRIHDEWIRNLAANSPRIPIERLHETRRLMEAALPWASVRDYEHHIADIVLPDPDDRHVVAAGIAAGASIILTWNTRDFPVGTLRRHGLRRRTPDALLTDLYDRIPDLTLASLANARGNLTKTNVSAGDFATILENQGFVRLAARLARHLGAL